MNILFSTLFAVIQKEQQFESFLLQFGRLEFNTFDVLRTDTV